MHTADVLLLRLLGDYISYKTCFIVLFWVLCVYLVPFLNYGHETEILASIFL